MDQTEQPVCLLYYGDNLRILRTNISSASVDLIYLDPPFYSQRNYQAFFKKSASTNPGGSKVSAFGDTWRWDPEVQRSYRALLQRAPVAVGRALRILHDLLGPGPLLAYLVMMGERLLEVYRVLKTTGSIYLHCDSSASHYLKLLLDVIFGGENFRNEIVWCYKTGGASRRHFARKHDVIFFYSKSEHYTFHIFKEKSYMMHRYGFKKSEFLHDERGDYTWVYMKDVWELPALGAADSQRLGYPTQKPEALLERIVQASSNPGEIILDPFGGSGTSLVVAQRLGRKWIGIEKHALGLAYQRYRLAREAPGACYRYLGGPGNVEEARQLAATDATQFRWWALSLVGARPGGEECVSGNYYPGGISGRISMLGEMQVEQLVIVIIDMSEWEAWQHAHEQSIDPALRVGVIITLEAFEPATQEILRKPVPFSRTGCTPDFPAIIPIADLLNQEK